ncbi:MAG: GNAT family N-acetyltransferase [Gallionella sp.]|jgi:hypothetical protein|nr:GNAT family N-acetyltransferase [Gallionella sp.]
MKIIPYQEEYASVWDDMVAASAAATILHTRRFLSYHGSRVADRSLLIFDDKERLIGVFPAALNPSCEVMVESHPGATYGGLVHAGKLRGEQAVLALNLISRHYHAMGITRLRYKAVPHIYHAAPAQDDLYAMFRLGAIRYRCDLSCAIDLAARMPASKRRLRSLKSAHIHGVEIVSSAGYAASIWSVLEENLARKHDAKPIHTLQEILVLHERFPRQIEFVAAKHAGVVVAGALLFHSPTVVHAQYIASSEVGYNLHALDALFEWCIRHAQQDGVRYFDFGISNENEGNFLNTGLYNFKTEFGGGGIVHEFFELNLQGENHAA